MESEEILVTVRTYPTPSKRHVETVCTAGITTNFEWRRLYPISLRLLEDQKQFKTWDVVQVQLDEGHDGRPETRRPRSATLIILRSIDSWESRRDWIDRTTLASMEAMSRAERSIGPVAVERVDDFTWQDTEPEWSPDQLEIFKQPELFVTPEPPEKIPFKFYLHWVDGEGEKHRSQVISWETAQAWRSYRHRYKEPLAKLREKLLDDYFSESREPRLFMGNHYLYRKNWMVCGWFIPPRTPTEDSQSGFDW
jgi:hypothetical protein